MLQAPALVLGSQIISLELSPGAVIDHEMHVEEPLAAGDVEDLPWTHHFHPLLVRQHRGLKKDVKCLVSASAM